MNNNTIDPKSVQYIIDQFVDVLKQNYENAGVRASGNLIDNLSGKLVVNGDIYTVSLNLPEYYKYIESGRRPGKFPPINKIKEWMRVKPILPTPINGKLPTENQLAFLIGRSIAQNGIPAKPVIARSLSQFNLIGQIYDEISNQLIEKVVFPEIDEALK